MIRSSSASYALIKFSSRFKWFVGLAVENRRMGESDIGGRLLVVVVAVAGVIVLFLPNVSVRRNPLAVNPMRVGRSW